MDKHSWLDVYGYVFNGAVTLLAVFLAYRLNRHDSERKGFQDDLRDCRERLTAAEAIIELVKQAFRFK